MTVRDGERLEVAQSIEARVGPFRFSSSSVRAVELTPQREIRSTLVSGDFDTFVGTTRLVERGRVGGIAVMNGVERHALTLGPGTDKHGRSAR